MLQPLQLLYVGASHADEELIVAALRAYGFAPAWRRIQTEAEFVIGLQPELAVVIFDYEWTGFEARRALELVRERGFDVSLIFISGMPGEEAAVAAMKVGAADYVRKDRLGRLGPAIEEVLARPGRGRPRRERSVGRRESDRLALAALNSLTSHVAVLDEWGTVLAVNEAWRSFAVRNGAAPDRVGEGSNYLEVCERDQGPDAWAARAVARGIRKVLDGQPGEFETEYPCHAPDERRWFVARVTALGAAGPRRVVVSHDNVTARKQQEEARRESEEKFSTLVALSPEAVFINQGNRVVYVNRRGLDLWQAKSEDELLGRAPLELFHPDSHAAIRSRIAALSKPGASVPVQELKVVTCTGQTVQVETMGAAFTYGGAPAIQVIVHDISERKAAEVARERQQRRVALLGDISRRLVLNETAGETLAGIFDDLARELTIDIYANYMMAPSGDLLTLESSGGLSEELRRDFARLPVGVSLCGLVAQRQESLVFADLPRSTEPQAAGIIALGVRAYAGFPLRANGQLVGTVSFGSRTRAGYSDEDLQLMKTVADQVAAALERSRLVQALRASEVRFREVVENIKEVFWLAEEPTKRIVYVSPGYEKVWGRSCASLYAAGSAWSDTLHPEDRERVLAAVREKQARGTYDETYRIVRPDGALRWVRERAFPVRQESGLVTRVVGVAEDITERKNLEEQFLRAQRLEAIGTLASGIAHDLNNILAPVLMIPPLLRKKITDPHDVELLDLVETGAQRGAGIVRQLLTFSRGIAGDRGPVQPRRLIKEVLGIVRETFPRDILVEERQAKEVWPVLADATQLHQVLLNLCVNARDAMPQGGRLTLGAENAVLTEADVAGHLPARPGLFVRLTVADTGEGIARANLDRIFEPFFTTKGVGKGTGLGLSTVLGIVRSHCGFVTVTSEAGAGAVFSVLLPVAGGAIERVEPTESTTLPRAAGEGVLLVDDEEAIRVTLRVMLERQNFRVFQAQDGEAALAVFKANRDDVRLVLIDLMMPVLGGCATVRAIRAAAPELPIAVMSGYVTEEIRAELTALGVKTILNKPFRPEDLIETLRDALRVRP